MPKLTLLMFAALFAAPSQAEIFKCVTRTGADAYQNFPCETEPIGSAQQVSAAGPAPAAGDPKIGMTIAEVAAIWGEPVDRYEDEQRKVGSTSGGTAATVRCAPATSVGS